MTTDPALLDARAAFDRSAWSDAYAGLTEADGRSAAGERGPRAAGDRRVPARAARRLDGGRSARPPRGRPEGDVGLAIRSASGSGWSTCSAARWPRQAAGSPAAARLVEESGYDGVERGYLLIPQALQSLMAGRPGRRLRDVRAGRRHRRAVRRRGPRERSGRLGRGQSLIAHGRDRRGVALLDEAMAAVIAGEVSPIVVRHRLLRGHRGVPAHVRPAPRAGVDGGAHRWCESQPDLVPFRGQLPGLPRRADALPRGVARRGGRGAARAGLAVAAAARAGRRRGVSTSSGRAGPTARRVRGGRGRATARPAVGPPAGARARAAAPGTGRRRPLRGHDPAGAWPRRPTSSSGRGCSSRGRDRACGRRRGRCARRRRSTRPRSPAALDAPLLRAMAARDRRGGAAGGGRRATARWRPPPGVGGCGRSSTPRTKRRASGRIGAACRALGDVGRRGARDRGGPRRVRAARRGARTSAGSTRSRTAAADCPAA